MPRYTVTNVDRTTIGETPCWMIKFEVTDLLPDQQPIHYYIFPEFTLEQRVAEYNLDPQDVDSIVDIIIGEQFITGPDGQPTLHDAPSVEEARAAHVRRCAAAKLAARVSSRGVTNPLEMIRSSFIPDPERIKARRAVVSRNRSVIPALKKGNARG